MASDPVGDANRRFGLGALVVVIIGVIVVIGAAQSMPSPVPAPHPAAAASRTWAHPAKSALPPNVQSLLDEDWAGTAADVTTADAAESMVGASAWIGSNTLPGTLTVGHPNAQGAELVTWHLNGVTFAWLLSADGNHATAQNQRSYLALQGINDP